MKRILYITTALVALAACNVTNIDKQSPAADDGTSFVKGQKVTLTVGTGIQTKVSSELVTTGEDKDKVNFKWETGDKILVKVGEATAEFTLKSGAGSATATFEGTMPADGTTFDVQFPVKDPDLTAQTYKATEAIPHNTIKFTASGCTIGTGFTLVPQSAVLRVNLYGSGWIQKISIVMGEETYILSGDFNLDGTTSTSPKPFFFVVPPSASTSFDVIVYKYGTATVGSFSTSDKTLETGNILSMAAKYVVGTDYPGTDEKPIKIRDKTWAPVNCGYEQQTGDSGAALGYPYGKMYQWGRRYGQGYKDSTFEDADYPGKAEGSQSIIEMEWGLRTYPDGDKYNGIFYATEVWYLGGDSGTPVMETLWGANRTEYDPCPTGWRVPTYAELETLLGSHTVGSIQTCSSGIHAGMKGWYFDGSKTAMPTSGLFLPAAGHLYWANGKAELRGVSGAYRSSSLLSDRKAFSWRLFFDGHSAYMNDTKHIGNGFSVRCVQD